MARHDTDPQVDDWFQKLDHPLKGTMLAVRQVMLDADPRISESIKWSTPTFSFRGNLASIQPRAKQYVSLLFHTGSAIPGDHPRLEGDAPLARVIRFRDEDEVERYRSDLQRIVQAWCALKEGGGTAA